MPLTILPVGDLPKGSACHPRSTRPGISYLRTTWTVAGRNTESQVILKSQGKIILLDPRARVQTFRPA